LHTRNGSLSSKVCPLCRSDDTKPYIRIIILSCTAVLAQIIIMYNPQQSKSERRHCSGPFVDDAAVASSKFCPISYISYYYHNIRRDTPLSHHTRSIILIIIWRAYLIILNELCAANRLSRYPTSGVYKICTSIWVVSTYLYVRFFFEFFFIIVVVYRVE
jgi:hypothetical protein